MMMEQLALVIALLVLCIMACTATEEWSPEEYPDPQKDPGACGRGNVKSFVCDPNGLIPSEDADMLNVIIKEVDFKTKVSCSSHGYRIGIALVKKLKDKSTNTMTGKTEDERIARRMMRALHLTKKFASETHNRWNLGDCNEDVIITYSQEDDVLYTFAGKEAQRKLSPFIINDITHKANIKDTHISDSLSKMICNYGAVFNGTYTPSYIQPTFYPQYEPVRSAVTSSAGRPHLYFGVLLAALFDSLFLSRTV